MATHIPTWFLLLVIIGLLAKLAYGDRFMAWRIKRKGSVYNRRGLLVI